jgi:hypothetical protein
LVSWFISAGLLVEIVAWDAPAVHGRRRGIAPASKPDAATVSWRRLSSTNTMAGLTLDHAMDVSAKKRAALWRGSAEVYREASNRVVGATRIQLSGYVTE